MLAIIPRSVTSLLASFCLILTATTPLRAQTKGAGEVEVANVKFSSVRVPGNPNSAWYEVDVELQAKPASDANRFVNRVRVVLNLGIEISTTGGKRVEFYRSAAEAVALEAGKSNVRFYLPPEVVKRDRVSGDAKFYLVELAIGGQPVPLARSHVSTSSLPGPEAVNSFKAKIASEAAANDGVVLPQYLTPFLFDGSRSAPSCVRSREAAL